ncbi:hypothetical protein Tco_0172552 [Tanacetum coccineum]
MLRSVETPNLAKESYHRLRLETVYQRLGIVDGMDGTERGYQGRCLGEVIVMGESLSPDNVFNFPMNEPHPAYNFFAPAPLPRYAGNPNNNNGWLATDDYLLGELEAMLDE